VVCESLLTLLIRSTSAFEVSSGDIEIQSQLAIQSEIAIQSKIRVNTMFKRRLSLLMDNPSMFEVSSKGRRKKTERVLTGR
jgi:hypothetical protein